jgi:hypothetical protein
MSAPRYHVQRADPGYDPVHPRKECCEEAECEYREAADYAEE